MARTKKTTTENDSEITTEVTRTVVADADAPFAAKEGKTRKAKNSKRFTIDVPDNDVNNIAARLNEIHSNPNAYNQGGRKNYNTMNGIILDLLNIGLNYVFDNNANLDSLVRQGMARRMGVTEHLIGDLFSNLSQDQRNTQAQVEELLFYVKTLINHMIKQDKPAAMLAYKIEDLNNISNASISNRIEKIKEVLISDSYNVKNEAMISAVQKKSDF